MKVTAEKLDDINIIISGIIDNNMTEDKVAQLKAQASKDNKDLTKEMEDAIQQSAESTILNAFIEAGLHDAGVDVKDILGQPGFKKYEKRDNGLFLEIAVSTSPNVNTDIDYADIIPTFTQPKAATKDIEAKLQEMAIQQGTFASIPTPREVQDDDVTLIDFEGSIDGVAFDGGSAEKFNLKVGSDSFIPGFEEQLIGMVYEETKTVTVTFPEEYSSADLAGKEAKFKVKLHEIQAQVPKEINDAFAQSILGDEKATIDTLKAKLADQINSQALSQFYNDELKPILTKGLLSKFDFTLPLNIVEQEIDAKVSERIQQMSQEEKDALNKDKKLFHTLRKSLEEEAGYSIKKVLIIEALAKKEGLEVDEQEILSALYYQAMMSGQDAEELVKYYKDNNLMEAAKMGLTEDKLFGKILGLDKR